MASWRTRNRSAPILSCNRVPNADMPSAYTREQRIRLAAARIGKEPNGDSGE